MQPELLPIIIFLHHGLRYCLDARIICEIILLPRVTPIEEAPAYVIGLVNVRGKIIPIIDLNLVFGHAQMRYGLTDKIIIMEMNSLKLGVIVNEVFEVENVFSVNIEPVPVYGRADYPPVHFLSGEVKDGENIIMLLNHSNIFSHTEYVKEITQDFKIVVCGEFSPEASSEEKIVFHERAKALIQPMESFTVSAGRALAVISLGDEYYGVDAGLISEFSNLREVTAVPCTPAHVVGNINLRGDILTVIDIRKMLNIEKRDSVVNAKVMVLQAGVLFIGVMINDAVEIINVQESDIRPLPSASDSEINDFIKGELSYRQKMLSVLDLEKLLKKEELVVNEEA